MDDCDAVHTHHMHHALSMARRGLGITWPNPSVGCVIVKNGRVVGRGTTGRGGRPHAEVQALAQAGAQARGADVYVTLEPCVHQGRAAPCAQALVNAAVARVFIGSVDPDPRVNGRGADMLKSAGIEVFSGVCVHEAQKAHSGFISRVTQLKPFVTLKIATTHDGFTVVPDGQSRWITGDLARAHVQLARTQHDAVLAGIGTVLADNPMLNARVPGFAHETVRVILDSDLRTPVTSALVKSAAEYPLVIMHNTDKNGEELMRSGAELIRVDPHDVSAVLAVLAGRGINRLLVEGGAAVMRAFLSAGLWDEILWYRAPFSVGGGDAPQAQESLGIAELQRKYGLFLTKTRVLAQDTLEIYRKAQ